MMRWPAFRFTLSVALACIAMVADPSLGNEPPLPSFDQLPVREAPPDPLVMLDGTPVQSPEDWRTKRRPELIRLLQHYMYGKAPPAPEKIAAKTLHEDTKALSGKATVREIELAFGPGDQIRPKLLLVTPNSAKGPAPVVVALNFGGNQSVLDDPKIAIPMGWMYPNRKGIENNRATEASRGNEKEVWSAELLIERGYALATIYDGDFDADTPDFADGIHRFYYRGGQDKPGENEWGTVAAWAWGLSRTIDYLAKRDDIDAKRIVAYGHSRLGKTALWAGALDERIAVVCPHQSGTGGAAMSRDNDQEKVARINSVFPHWFADSFVPFGDNEAKLPFDQHCVMALCAPRPIYDGEGLQDKWANYDNAFRSLQGADPVYKLLGKRGLKAGRPIEADEPFTDDNFGELVQYRRDETHVMNARYWSKLLDFCDRWWAERDR